jgi:hypothetical protein
MRNLPLSLPNICYLHQDSINGQLLKMNFADYITNAHSVFVSPQRKHSHLLIKRNRTSFTANLGVNLKPSKPTKDYSHSLLGPDSRLAATFLTH